MRANVSSAEMQDLLHSFLAGDAVARDRLPRVARRYLFAVSARLAPELPEDLHGDVVDQALLNLLRQRPGSYCPSRASAGTYLGLMVRNAVRQVRAAYTPPGRPTRVRKRRAQPNPDQVVAVGSPLPLEELPEAEQPQAQDQLAAVEARLDAQAILESAPEMVGASLRRIHFDGEALEVVANSMGITRFVLSRRIADFARGIRAAA